MISYWLNILNIHMYYIYIHHYHFSFFHHFACCQRNWLLGKCCSCATYSKVYTAHHRRRCTSRQQICVQCYRDTRRGGPDGSLSSCPIPNKERVVHIEWFAVLLTCFLTVKVSILVLKLLIVTNSFNWLYWNSCQIITSEPNTCTHNLVWTLLCLSPCLPRTFL